MIVDKAKLYRDASHSGHEEILNSLCVLTSPIPVGEYFFTETLRQCWRLGRHRLMGNGKPFFGGHYAVTRSLIEGLCEGGLPYIYNPANTIEISSSLLVLAGAETLRQAIQLKKKKKVEFIAAGPNISIFSSDYGSLLADGYIDMVIVPSAWVARLYVEDHPELATKIFVWPAGVNPDVWSPPFIRPKGQALIFDKLSRCDRTVIDEVHNALKRRGYTVVVLKYGTYNQHQYLTQLQNSELMIGFTDSESQGIAWAEAWSADVPTFIFRNELSTYLGRQYACSTAPYLCVENGAFFSGVSEFEALLEQWQTGALSFSPRKWVLSNMTDEYCAKRLYKKVMAC